MFKRILLVIGLLAVLAVIGAFAWASRHGEVAAITPPAAGDFDATLVQQGEVLAGIGNCSSCHTAADGADYAGGYSMATPFGIVYSTNITPDPEAGIGTWSEAAFARALRQGLDREGNHLYPVFPYDHFTLLSDEDVAALYAFFMTREPVATEVPENLLDFPFDNRILLAGWKYLHLDERRFQPDPEQSEEWNRGAYLVEGLGHCGACHTPRDRLGAVDADAKFAGAGLGGGWYAPALDASSPAVVPWTEDAMVNYLLDGWDSDHGIAAGPMTKVVNNLYDHLSENDAYAMAAYLLPFQPQPTAEPDILRAEAVERSLTSQMLDEAELALTADDPVLAAGQALFARSCANCHRQGTDTVPLGLTTSMNVPDPRNMLSVTRHGIRPPVGVPSKTMPNFAGLTREDLAALARYSRWQFTDLPEWEGMEEALDDVLGEVDS